MSNVGRWTARNVALGCATLAAGAVGLIAVVFGVAFAGLVVADRLGLYEDYDPDVSEAHARSAVAEYLCPQDPERMMPRLKATNESGARLVYADPVLQDG
jgi:hypothetical protein